MIITRLSGGLGNQLFQYAVARQLAFKHSTDLILDIGWYKKFGQYTLHNFPIKARVINQSEMLVRSLHTNPILRRIKFLPKIWNECREISYYYNDAINNQRDNSYLIGYWQSYKYFEDINNNILDELTPIIRMSDEIKDIINLISNCESVSLHVRRGDYVNNSEANKVHGLCSLEYYRSAIQYFNDQLINPHFYIFSDDLEWCRKNLLINGKSTIVSIKDSSALPHIDLFLMSICKHNIIANSTFSWWGAWLNRNKYKKICAPLKWFADGRSSKDLIPSDWIKF